MTGADQTKTETRPDSTRLGILANSEQARCGLKETATATDKRQFCPPYLGVKVAE